MPRPRPGVREPLRPDARKPQGLFVVGPDLRVLATDALLPLSLGMSAALMRGRGAAELFGPEVAARLAEVLADGRPVRCTLGGKATLAIVSAECAPQLAAEPAPHAGADMPLPLPPPLPLPRPRPRPGSAAPPDTAPPDVVGIVAKGLPRGADDAVQGMPFVEVLHRLCAQLLEVLGGDPTPMLDAVLERACANGPYDLAMVWLLDDASGALRPAAWRGYRDPRVAAALARKTLGPTTGRRLLRVMTHAVPCVEEDVPNADGMNEFKQEDVLAAAFVPVCSRERTLGVLHVGSRTPHHFHPGELRVLEILGSLAGVAVQKARLYRDVIEAGRQRDQSRNELARAFTVLRSMPDVVAALAAGGHVEFVNDAGRRLVGAGPEDDPTSVTLARLMGPGAERRLRGELLPTALRRGTWSGEVELIGPDGRHKPFSLVLARHSRPDGSPYFSFVARDIRRLKSLERRLEDQATHDALTRVLNRRGFQAALEQRLARGALGAGGTLLFIDLDDFKELNDTLGHGAGDALLKAVALRLRQLLPRGVVLARLGGDEFAALLRGGEANASNVARHLLAGLRAFTFDLPGGHRSGVTASVGIARCTAEDGADAGAWLSRADIAMYQAKARGRDTFALYSESTGRQWRRSTAVLIGWEARVKRALETDGFVLHAQPVSDLRTGRPVYWELLIRLADEEGTLVPPDRFLGVAERFGLIGAVDRWVAHQALRLLQATGPDTCVGVNVSAKSLFDPAAVQREVARLAASGVAPRRLVFEITETAQIAHPGDLRRSVATLREAGYLTALDDFGVGFASLDLLKTLPLDFLKIDRRFVQNLGRGATDRPIVEGLVRIARGLGLRTVAEGIEDGETLAVLRELGVDCGQGFHIARPAAARDVVGSDARASLPVQDGQGGQDGQNGRDGRDKQDGRFVPAARG